jgi:hypothetical protein
VPASPLVSGDPTATSRLVPRWGLFLFTLPLLLAGSARSDTRIVLDGGRVSIHAESTPLAEILGRFAKATGAEIVFESTQPRQILSVGIEADSEVEALVRLLEGQGVNYALRLDPTGREVEMVVISAKAGLAAAAAPPTRTPRTLPPMERTPEDVDQTQTFVPEIAEEPDPASSGNIPERVINPVFGPSQPQPPSAASYPGSVAAPGTTPAGAPASPAPRPSYPDSPSYPGRASYPGSPRE